MDFTEIYKQSSNLASFSPGAKFLLTAVEDRLIVRRCDTFQIARTWHTDNTASASASILSSSISSTAKGKLNASRTSEGWVTHIGWSNDSEYVFAACAKQGVVNVYKMRDENWNARIEAGAEGLARAEWAPNGRSILCFSEWGLRVTIWSLVTGTATYIQYPKHPDRGHAFRKDGRYFILAERHRSKDTIGVYEAPESYKLVRHFTLPTSSLSSIALSPSGVYLAVWEGPLDYKLYVYSLLGQQVGTFVPDPGPGLGIRAVAWHPTSSFIAVGGWDDKVHIISCFGWTEVATFELTSRIPSSVVIWREPRGWYEATLGRGFLPYDRIPYQINLPILRSDPSKPNPKSGTIQLEWNTTGSLLFVRFEQTPVIVHIFNFPTPSSTFTPSLRTVLMHSQPVQAVRWNPVRSGSLAICCGNGAMYTWEEETDLIEDEGEGDDKGDNGNERKRGELAECIGIPATQFETRDIRWGPDGRGLILFDKDAFCCAFQLDENDLDPQPPELEGEFLSAGDLPENHVYAASSQ